MAPSDNEDERRYMGPYTSRHPIPTVKHYREVQSQRKEAARPAAQDDGFQPDARNKNTISEDSKEYSQHDDKTEDRGDESDVDEVVKDTSEAVSSGKDAKGKRKDLKKRGNETAERVVTDPVTHLPVRIHDLTKKDLDEGTADSKFDHQEYARSPTSASSGDEDQLKQNAVTGERTHREMERLFPPPNFDVIKSQLARTHTISLAAAVVSTLIFIGIPLLAKDSVAPYFSELVQDKSHNRGSSKMDSFASLGTYLLSAATAFVFLWTIRTWNVKKVDDIWQSSVWESERQQGKRLGRNETPESTHWFNALMSSIWPLMNPDIFTSVADTLEDVMQASLPKLVRMISVEDLGQGSEPFRILGVRWLPKGAAGKSVTQDGKVKNEDKKAKKSDRTVQGEGSIQSEDDDKDDKDKNDDEPHDKKQQEEEEAQKIAEGMQAEEGDFVNLELAVAFRARLAEHGLKSRSNNPHLYLAFYMPAGVKFPVWVELRGFIATMRLRLQLTPDPPFFSICTLTFLGQPKVDLSCVPLVKKGLNIMDLPILSNFVQSAIDAAMAEYVAPKSLTLDLKNMLVGDDFKKDTLARGVIVVKIKHAYDFKEGDAGFASLKKGSTDGYVTVGWAKFGKPVWSTRVIKADMKPVWDETAYIAVTAQELNVREKIRLQLWDSDRMSADDDLGRIEVDLNDVMKGEQSKNKQWDREDGFRALKAGQGMPGKLAWSIGYYPKTQLLEEQLRQSDEEPDVKTLEELKRKVYKESERKLREASKDESDEIEQQKIQDFKEKQDEMIISVPPPKDYPSGVLSIVVHQIQGLELETLKKTTADKKESSSDEQEEGDDLPSSYCTIVLNHQKIYKTRTKPKNAMPFFNAGTERFVPDITKAHVHIAVRDSRVHEDDPLIGVVDLPMEQVFDKRSQVVGFWPLGGGLGFGQVRISMVFRSVELQLPKELLGWEYGTLEIQPEIKGEVPSELQSCKIKVKTNIGSRKLYSQHGTVWKSKKEEKILLGVQKRYSSCVAFQFRSTAGLGSSTPGFAILWLKDIPDDEEKSITLTVWKGDLERARNNACDDYGEKLGQIQVTLNLWSGLSGYHLPLAKNDPNVEDIMEILDCANDNNDEENIGDDASSSDSSSDEDNDGNGAASKIKNKLLGRDSNLADDGERGVKSQLLDYKENRKQLHRRNRGLMQWKAPRTMKWMSGKITSGEHKIGRLFGHHQTGDKIETEA